MKIEIYFHVILFKRHFLFIYEWFGLNERAESGVFVITHEMWRRSKGEFCSDCLDFLWLCITNFDSQYWFALNLFLSLIWSHISFVIFVCLCTYIKIHRVFGEHRISQKRLHLLFDVCMFVPVFFFYQLSRVLWIRIEAALVAI